SCLPSSSCPSCSPTCSPSNSCPPPSSSPIPSSRVPSYSPSSSCPLLPCLGFSFSSRLIVFVEVARMGAVSLSEVGLSRKVRLLGKVSLSGKVVLVLFATEGGGVKAGSGSCYQGGCGFLVGGQVGFASCSTGRGKSWR